MCTLPFKSAFGCFKGFICVIILDLFFLVLWAFLGVDLAFFAYEYLAILVTTQIL